MQADRCHGHHHAHQVHRAELRAADVEMWLVRLHGDALRTSQKAGVIDALGEENLMPTVRLAGQRLRNRPPGADGPAEGASDDRPD